MSVVGVEGAVVDIIVDVDHCVVRGGSCCGGLSADFAVSDVDAVWSRCVRLTVFAAGYDSDILLVFCFVPCVV
jgi:hypothetical protein